MPATAGSGASEARLPEPQVQRAREQLRAAARAHLEEAEKAVGGDPSQSLLARRARKAKHLWFRELNVAAEELLEQGRYTLVPTGTASPAKPENTESVTLGDYHHPELGRVHVEFFVPDLPMVAERARTWTELESAVDAEFVNSFNSHSYDERRQRWEAHLRALREVAQVRQDPGLPERERALRADELEKRSFPTNKFRLDPSHYTLHVR